MSSANFPAGCFGKLPTYGDFIRHNAASREALDFDQWIQQGLHSVKERCKRHKIWPADLLWDLAFQEAAPQHFLFHPAESADRFLIGIMKPSHDQSKRRYPFLVFTQADRRIADQVKLVPLAFARFFGRALELVQQAETNGMEPPAVAQNVDFLSAPVALDWKKLADQYYAKISGITLEDLFTRLFGRFEDARKYLLFKNLKEVLRPPHHKVAWGVRFPLSPLRELIAYEACFWLQVSLRLLGNPPVIPIFFWTVAEESKPKPAYLYFFLRRPSSHLFDLLINAQWESEAVNKLDENDKEKMSAAAEVLPPAYRDMLERPRMNLQEVLMRL
ncbi:type VI secretion system-associated protein TagF [candidate division KSB1 bacterium]|nr:type VI secretion system-associated protein TagF [candidate division KSB1 bacterium]